MIRKYRISEWELVVALLPFSETVHRLFMCDSAVIQVIVFCRSRLVNTSLLSEVLVQESLIDHFSALRALLLLHDAHFARALTVNLFTKVCQDLSCIFLIDLLVVNM